MDVCSEAAGFGCEPKVGAWGLAALLEESPVMPLLFVALLAGENKPPLELGADDPEALNAFAKSGAAVVDGALAPDVDCT